jgi:bacitracin transport system permease protein
MGSIIFSEIQKLKRSLVIWLIPICAFFPAFLSFSIYLDQDKMSWIGTGWGPILHTALVFMNYDGPCIFSIITGYIFANEYRNNTINVIFTIPIKRFKLFIGKLTVILSIIASTFLLSALFILILGFFLPHENINITLVWSYLKVMLLVIAANFSLVPTAALVAVAARNSIVPTILGISYALLFIPSAFAKHNYLLPWCIPAITASQAGKSLNGYIDGFRGNLWNCFISLVLTFTLFLLLSIIYYNKSDVK